MERKGPRSAKPKNVPPRDLFALGSKSTAVGRSGVAGSSINQITESQQGTLDKSYSSKSSGGADRARDGSLPGTGRMSKKLTQRSAFMSSSNLSRQISQKSSGETSETWESVAHDIDLQSLLPCIEAAEDRNCDETIEGYLCGAVKALKSQRMKPDISLCLTLLYLAKVKPWLFTPKSSSHVIDALCSLLKRSTDVPLSFKVKHNSNLPIVAANILLAVLKDHRKWPEILVRVYIEDSMGERLWVDHEECKDLVDNIIASFGTKVPPKNMFSEIGITTRTECPSPSVMEVGEGDLEITFEDKEHSDVVITNRYSHMTMQIEEIVMEAVQSQLNGRHHNVDSVTRNFLKFLASVSGIQEVRRVIAPKLEMWIQKHHRIANDLLLSLCTNCSTHSTVDHKLISYILHLRIKQQKLYMTCVRELLTAHPENIVSVIRETIFNELSGKRNCMNMTILSVAFQYAPDQAALILADIFMELLRNADDFLRALRTLLREIIRSVKHDMHYQRFCQGLMKDQTKDTVESPDLRDRIFYSICDIICLTFYVSITPQVRELSSQAARSDRDLEPLRKHQELMMNIQLDALHWFHRIVPLTYSPNKDEFLKNLQKVLMIAPIEVYNQVDGWPAEHERALLFRLSTEVPVREELLLRLCSIINMQEQGVKAQEGMDLIEKLLRRVTSSNQDMCLLQINDVNIIDLIFNLCAYFPPDNTVLPQGYKQPITAIANSYWKAWSIVLLITANNPTIFGSRAWEKYPTLRVMMEMCITNSFVFPPPTMCIGDKGDEMTSQELMLSAQERQQIIEFESHLAQKNITEQNSLLISQLITMDPNGPARKPPATVMEQLKSLNTANRIGHLLCKCRDPDFLLDIIQRQGAPRSMPWLAELVKSSENEFSSLPVQCLCEYLLSETILTPESSITSVHHRLVQHLRNLLHDDTLSVEIMDYFLRRLGSEQPLARAQSVRGLNLLVAPINETMEVDANRQEPFVWLLHHLPQLPSFSQVQLNVCTSLRAACQIETQPQAVSAYIRFLAMHTTTVTLSEMSVLVRDMAQLIVERTTMTSAILPAVDPSMQQNPHAKSTLNSLYLIFLNFMRNVRRFEDPISWSENHDHVRIQWSSGEQADMHILVVHAMVILLIFGPTANSSIFHELLEIWFPRDQEMPQAFLVDTMQEALLLPDWLKLRMIRSTVPQLVDAALKDLEPSQLVLFIQSFGIPVESMTKLLCALDLAVNSSEESVTAAVLDRSHKTYMSQLVEVQNRRGATGGGAFATILVEKEGSDTSTDPPVTIKPLVTPLTIPVGTILELKTSEVQSFICQCFTSTNLLNEHEKQVKNTLRVLQQHISKEIFSSTPDKPYLHELLRSFTAIIQSEAAPSFVQGLHVHYQLSAPLFRLLLQMKDKCYCNKIYMHFVKVITQLRELVRNDTSVLTPILKSFTPLNVQQNVGQSMMLVKSEDLTSEDTLSQLLFANLNNLEKVLQHLVELGFGEKIGLVVTTIAKIISKKIILPVDTEITGEHYALLLDWLQMLDPELSLVPWDVKQLLLFSQNSTWSQSYLLSLFTHQTTWSTIGDVLSKLFNEFQDCLNATSVLNFANAVIHVPKLWQGRERRTPKHFKQQCLVHLSSAQILVLVQYILNECKQSTEVRVGDRVQLLFYFVYGTQRILEKVVELLLTHNTPKAGQILYEMYLKHPNIIKYVTRNDQYSLIKTQVNQTGESPSTIDPFVHTLLTMLCSPLGNKDFVRRMTDFEAALRKIVSCHPLLFLRHLPLLASSLQGKCHIRFQALQSRNYIVLFNIILGLLELLQPLIFLPKYQKPFGQILDSFIDIFDAHGRNKELNVMLNRTCQLLLSWVGAGDSFASSYVAKHAGLFTSLVWKHSDPPVRSLAAISASNGTDSKPVGRNHSIEAICQLGEYEGPPLNYYTHQRIRSLKNDFENPMTDQHFVSLLCSLQELTDYSLDHALFYFTKPLSEGISSTSFDVRRISWDLIGRLLRVKPKVWPQLSCSVLAALNTEDASVANCALEHLPEVILYMHEASPDLLSAAYNVCLSSESSQTDTLSEALFMLAISTGA